VKDVRALDGVRAIAILLTILLSDDDLPLSDYLKRFYCCCCAR
jgi:hypothetical protein